MNLPKPNSENYQRLLTLSPDEALKRYLNGEFAFGEESALTQAIRRGLPSPLSQHKIEDILLDSLEEGATAEECKNRLLDACR